MRTPDKQANRGAESSDTRPASQPPGVGCASRRIRQEEFMAFRVQSETGRLRQVILHRPDLELKRLT
ncbi:hypothetical protein, partial [Yinghuangia sp. YIM S10712]|uniref:hypothetical protein n=1 Tax=Yinghuangia sp. YIM S10712 TaxID=3436930 RepID=UPI003F53A9F8